LAQYKYIFLVWLAWVLVGCWVQIGRVFYI